MKRGSGQPKKNALKFMNGCGTTLCGGGDWEFRKNHEPGRGDNSLPTHARGTGGKKTCSSEAPPQRPYGKRFMRNANVAEGKKGEIP